MKIEGHLRILKTPVAGKGSWQNSRAVFFTPTGKGKPHSSFVNVSAKDSAGMALARLPENTVIYVTEGHLVVEEYKTRQEQNARDAKIVIRDFRIVRTPEAEQPAEETAGGTAVAA